MAVWIRSPLECINTLGFLLLQKVHLNIDIRRQKSLKETEMFQFLLQSESQMFQFLNIRQHWPMSSWKQFHSVFP